MHRIVSVQIDTPCICSRLHPPSIRGKLRQIGSLARARDDHLLSVYSDYQQSPWFGFHFYPFCWGQMIRVTGLISLSLGLFTNGAGIPCAAAFAFIRFGPVPFRPQGIVHRLRLITQGCFKVFYTSKDSTKMKERGDVSWAFFFFFFKPS